jgi:hypothetical protein
MELSGQLDMAAALPVMKSPPETHWVGPRVGLDAVE